MCNDESTYKEITIQEAMKLASEGGNVYRKWKGYDKIYLMDDFCFYTEDKYYKLVEKKRFYISLKEVVDLYFNGMACYSVDTRTDKVTKIVPVYYVEMLSLPSCFCSFHYRFFIYQV